MTEREWYKKRFKGKCPYTGKHCDDWDCDNCEVEKEEREWAQRME